MQLWKDAVPDPLQTIVPTNEALTIKEWIELVKLEHNYHLHIDNAEDSPKSPLKCNDTDSSMVSQVESLITTLNETDEDNTTEVVVYQMDHSGQRLGGELQELSDFDPYLPTSVEMQVLEPSKPTPNSFSVQVVLKIYCQLTLFAHLANYRKLEICQLGL